MSHEPAPQQPPRLPYGDFIPAAASAPGNAYMAPEAQAELPDFTQLGSFAELPRDERTQLLRNERFGYLFQRATLTDLENYISGDGTEEDEAAVKEYLQQFPGQLSPRGMLLDHQGNEADSPASLARGRLTREQEQANLERAFSNYVTELRLGREIDGIALDEDNEDSEDDSQVPTGPEPAASEQSQPQPQHGTEAEVETEAAPSKERSRGRYEAKQSNHDWLDGFKARYAADPALAEALKGKVDFDGKFFTRPGKPHEQMKLNDLRGIVTGVEKAVRKGSQEQAQQDSETVAEAPAEQTEQVSNEQAQESEVPTPPAPPKPRRRATRGVSTPQGSGNAVIPVAASEKAPVLDADAETYGRHAAPAPEDIVNPMPYLPAVPEYVKHQSNLPEVPAAQPKPSFEELVARTVAENVKAKQAFERLRREKDYLSLEDALIDAYVEKATREAVAPKTLWGKVRTRATMLREKLNDYYGDTEKGKRRTIGSVAAVGTLALGAAYLASHGVDHGLHGGGSGAHHHAADIASGSNPDAGHAGGVAPPSTGGGSREALQVQPHVEALATRGDNIWKHLPDILKQHGVSDPGDGSLNGVKDAIADRIREVNHLSEYDAAHMSVGQQFNVPDISDIIARYNGR